MSSKHETRDLLVRYAKARIPLITIRTDERRRAIEILTEVAEELGVKVYCHTKSKGIYDVTSMQTVCDGESVYEAFDFMREQMKKRSQLTFALSETGDISTETGDAQDLYDLVQSAVDASTTIIVITNKDVWGQLQQTGLVVVLDRPNEEEAYAVIRGLIDQYRGSIPIEWTDEEVREAASALAGVSQIEIENTIASLIANGHIGEDDLVEIRGSKDKLFSNISGLEKIQTSKSDAEVGGLAALQEWCKEKKELLTPEKRDALLKMGLKPPRGILLVGVPGCGKSLSAKSIASSWKLPLYRLDFATVQGSYVGQTERQLKEAFTMAEAVSPCVLWIDEIEKGLSGATASAGDGGVSTRMVGQFLFWLQECMKMVFVIATANNVSQLPPELLRRGRFDEIFFVDLPTTEERQSIMSLYMKKYLSLNFAGPLADELVELTEGFSGADLESTIRDLAYRKVANPQLSITADIIRKAFNNVVPLSQTSPEQIESIQNWGRERAVPASGKPIGSHPLQRSEGPRVREVLI